MTKINALDIDKIDFNKSGGLVPAIVQNGRTGQVLMLGYMDRAALDKTLESGLVTFFSRSKGRLWTKGESSGNTLRLLSVAPDCDQDALLVQALPAGPTCHLGTVSCFDAASAPPLAFLSELEALIESRKTADKSSSYTAGLLQGPLVKLAQKVGEEGLETALAAVAETDEDFTNEAADLLYHLMVLLSAKNMTIEDITERLQSRHKA